MCDVMADILERTNNKKQASSDSLLNKIQKALGFSGSKLVDTFWSGGLSDQELIQRHETLLAEEELPEEEAELTNRRVSNMRGYRYSFTDGHYREYVNQYSDNELAKSAKQRGKERDRKRYMNLKFALQEEGEFTVSNFIFVFILFLVGMSKRKRYLHESTLYRSKHSTNLAQIYGICTWWIVS